MPPTTALKPFVNVDDPDSISFVRSIVEKVTEITNQVFRDHLCQMLTELERIKRAEQQPKELTYP